jgi:hypothetical protein
MSRYGAISEWLAAIGALCAQAAKSRIVRLFSFVFFVPSWFNEFFGPGLQSGPGMGAGYTWLQTATLFMF